MLLRKSTLLLAFVIIVSCGVNAQGDHFIAILDGVTIREDDTTKLRLLQELADNPLVKQHPDTLALVLHEIAKVQWGLGQGSLALHTDKEALRLRRRFRDTDPENYCKSAYNLALGFNTLGQRDSAIHYFDVVIRVSPRNRQKSRSAYELGNLYKVNGEFALAINYGFEALRFAQLDTLHREIQNAYTLILDTYTIKLHQGDTDAGDSLLQFIPLPKQYYASLPNADNITLKNYALIFWYESHPYKFRNDYDKAEELIGEAQKLFIQSGIDNKLVASELLNSRGILLRRMSKYPEAFNALNSALEIRSAMSDSINMAVTHNNLGDLFFEQQLYPQALQHYHASIKLIAGQSLSDEISALPSSSLLQNHPRLLDAFRYVGFKADAWRQYCKDSGDSSYCDEALKAYTLTDSLVDILRSGHLREGSKLFWREDAKRLYAGAIDAAVEMGEYDLALYFSDRSKAVLVLDAVREHVIRNTPARELLETKDRLQEKIAMLEKSRNIDQQWITLTASLDQVNAQLRDFIPLTNMFSTKRLHELQRQMEEDKAIIQYFNTPESRDVFNTPDTLYAFVITNKGIKAIGLSKPAVIEALQEYQETNRVFLEEGIVEAMSAGPDKLYMLLIKPLEPLPGTLTIIPDGVIAQIGFDGLRDQEGRYLIESKTIRYDLSLAMGQAMSKMQPGFDERILALAPMNVTRCALNTLRYTRKELKGIGSIVMSKLLFGQKASKGQLFQLVHDYRILHLATHASANISEPGKSWIALSGDTTTCDLLYVQDLYTQHLPSSMVVVSACEGAHGVYASGEGAMSVARGFAFAGAASIITSLWQVNDEATADIMKSYYAHLTKGLTKSEALRQAKLDYIHDDRRKKMELHPAWWSAFIVIGNDSPLQLQPAGNLSFVYFIVIAFVALAVILFYRWKRIPRLRSE